MKIYSIDAGLKELIVLADGYGRHNSLNIAISALDTLPNMSLVEQREVVYSYSNELIRGVLSYNVSPTDAAKLVNRLRELSYSLGMEVYTPLFDLLYRYDEIPDDTAESLKARKRFDETGSKIIITAGARIVDVMNGEADLRGMNRGNVLKIAGNVLLFALKHGGPEMQIKAIEALSNFNGSRLKKELDGIAKRGDIVTRKTVEETIDVMRALESFNSAMFHKRDLLRRYSDEYRYGPQKFVIDVTYEAVEVLLSRENRRSVEDSIDNRVKIRGLVNMLESVGSWSGGFSAGDLESVVADIENALLHVVKRGKNERSRKEAIEALIKLGDPKVRDIFKKIFERRESGYDLVVRHTMPEPRRAAKSVPPPLPGKKKKRALRR